MDLPEGYFEREGRTYNQLGRWVELFEGKWLEVKNASREGWWRHHEHYDRQGYCDNPGRGY